MEPSSDGSVSSSEDESADGEEKHAEEIDLDGQSIGALSLFDEFFATEDFSGPFETDLIDPLAEYDASGPEVLELANQYIDNQIRQGMPTASMQNIVHIIHSRFIPFLRQRGYSGATPEEVVRNANANPRHEVAIAPKPLAGKPATAERISSILAKRSKYDVARFRPTYEDGMEKYKTKKEKKESQVGTKKRKLRKKRQKAEDDYVTKVAKSKNNDDPSGGGTGSTGMVA